MEIYLIVIDSGGGLAPLGKVYYNIEEARVKKVQMEEVGRVGPDMRPTIIAISGDTPPHVVT